MLGVWVALSDPQWLSGEGLKKTPQLVNRSTRPVKWLINPESRAARRSPEQHEAADLCCSVSTIAEAAKGPVTNN